MKKRVLFFSPLIFLCLISFSIAAQQTVNIAVRSIDILEVSGNPGDLVINKMPGEYPNNVIDNSTSYNITTNGINRKITGNVDVTTPTNCSLKIKLEAPTGASSRGDVVLSEVFASELVTGIDTLTESGLSITYTFSATIDTDIFGPLPRTVTFTLVDD